MIRPLLQRVLRSLGGTRNATLCHGQSLAPTIFCTQIVAVAPHDQAARHVYGISNPVEHTETADDGGTYDPWARGHLNGVSSARGLIGPHLPVYSGLFAGQRLSDVILMRQPPLVAQKTSEIVPVQIHSEYRAIIRAQILDHEMLHLREDGQPCTHEGFKTAWQRETNKPAFVRFRAERVVFHGRERMP
jgi:hypothetical protein